MAREGYEAPDGYGEEREEDEKREEEEEVFLVTVEIKPSLVDNDGLDNHRPPPRPTTPPLPQQPWLSHHYHPLVMSKFRTVDSWTVRSPIQHIHSQSTTSDCNHATTIIATTPRRKVQYNSPYPPCEKNPPLASLHICFNATHQISLNGAPPVTTVPSGILNIPGITDPSSRLWSHLPRELCRYCAWTNSFIIQDFGKFSLPLFYFIFVINNVCSVARALAGKMRYNAPGA